MFNFWSKSFSWFWSCLKKGTSGDPLTSVFHVPLVPPVQPELIQGPQKPLEDLSEDSLAFRHRDDPLGVEEKDNHDILVFFAKGLDQWPFGEGHQRYLSLTSSRSQRSPLIKISSFSHMGNMSISRITKKKFGSHPLYSCHAHIRILKSPSLVFSTVFSVLFFWRHTTSELM